MPSLHCDRDLGKRIRLTEVVGGVMIVCLSVHFKATLPVLATFNIHDRPSGILAEST